MDIRLLQMMTGVNSSVTIIGAISTRARSCDERLGRDVNIQLPRGCMALLGVGPQ